MTKVYTQGAGYRSTRITTATTTNIGVASRRTTLARIFIAVSVASTITIQDTAGNVKMVLPASYPVGNFELGLEDLQGLAIVTAGASDLVVLWSQT